MNKALLSTAALLGIASLFATSAHAQTLTFEGLQDQEPINNFYNGGTGGNGSGPGTNYGISFSSNSLALIESAQGGSGNFSGEPSPDTVLFFLGGSAATMNVPAGFNTGFSFFYADQVGFTGTINVYSGLNATGTLLATLSLPSTPNPYTVFVPIGVTFAGTAQSVDFGGAANFIAFDNITINSSVPGGSVPEPGSVALLVGMGTVGAGVLRKRRNR